MALKGIGRKQTGVVAHAAKKEAKLRLKEWKELQKARIKKIKERMHARAERVKADLKDAKPDKVKKQK
jgi:hypothetical protein